MNAKHFKQTKVPRQVARAGLYAIVAVLVAVTITDPLLVAANQYLESLLVSPYQLYLAELEHDHLEKVNERMKREIVALRTRQTSTRKIELKLVEKIDVVEKAIEDATNLDLFDSPQSSESSAMAGKLASILAAVEVKRASVSDDSQGVGGAERVCEENCDATNGFQDTFAAESVAHDPLVTSMTVAQARAERFVEVMRTLPIGAPVQARISSSYGYRRSPFSRKRSFHYGLDLALPSGSPVRATGGGKVIKAVYTRTYGHFVDIEHSSGLVTRYAHLRKSLVKRGDTVDRGDVIGLCGSTGRSTGPHVHYEVRYKGRTRNPAPFVGLANTLARVLALDSEPA